jgi:hypothetical protein
MTQPQSFRRAVEARDLEAIVATLSPDVVFHSPVVHRPIVGRANVTSLLEAVVATFHEFRYTQEFHDGPRSALVFEARVGDRSLQGVDLLEHDEHGRIERLTVMVRPLSGLTALGDAVRTRLEQDTTQ